MGIQNQYKVKVDPSIADNPVIRGEIKDSGPILCFEDRQSAEEWLNKINKYTEYSIVFSWSNNMSSYGPDVIATKEEKTKNTRRTVW